MSINHNIIKMTKQSIQMSFNRMNKLENNNSHIAKEVPEKF